MKSYKAGIGFDVHRKDSRKKGLVLGGVKITCPFGLSAVSDGDVLLHAVADSLCGAAGLGDIGDYFPPRAVSSKGLDSKDIIKFILKKIGKRSRIVNLDVIIVADKPPLLKYKARIVKSLKSILGAKDINVKIKSKEKTSILGGKNSISCFALCLLRKHGLETDRRR